MPTLTLEENTLTEGQQKSMYISALFLLMVLFTFCLFKIKKYAAELSYLRSISKNSKKGISESEKEKSN
jgi:hypothetical protein